MIGFCMQAAQRSRGAMLAVVGVDKTLVLILEQIDSLVSLIRAASTCRRWRRLIANASFLRRWRSLHGPPVAGDYYNYYRKHDEDDATSSPSFVSSSSVDARHFSLNFVVDATIFESRRWKSDIDPSWQVHDSRGSLLLMTRIPEPFLPGPFPDLVVCEPLTQRYRIIPRPPDFNFHDCIYRGTYLVDGDEDEAGGRIGISNFRVQCMLLSHEDELAHTTMFTAGHDDTDATWSQKAIDHIVLRLIDCNVGHCYLGHALGLSYFYVEQDGMLITRDGSTGKHCSWVLSRDIRKYWDGHDSIEKNFSVVDGGDGEPRIVTTTNRTLEVFAKVDEQWRLENKVLLSKITRCLPGYRPSLFNEPQTITRTGVGFVVISSREPNQQWSFSVDLKTMAVAPATKGSRVRMAYPCEFPWPPVLQVCLDR